MRNAPGPLRLASVRAQYALAVPCFVLATIAWQCAAYAFPGFESRMSSPLEIAAAVLQIAAHGSLLHDCLVSIKRVIPWIVLGASCAYAMALCAALLPPTWAGMRLLVWMCNGFPKLVVYLLAFRLFDLNDGPKYTLSFWIAFVFVLAPVFHTSAELLSGESAAHAEFTGVLITHRTLGAGRLALGKLLARELLPTMLTQSRVAAAIAWSLLIYSETSETTDGIGARIEQSFERADVSHIFAYALVLVACILCTHQLTRLPQLVGSWERMRWIRRLHRARAC